MKSVGNSMRKMCTKKMLGGVQKIRHGSIADTWDKGDGVINQQIARITFWNVNGIRAICRKGGMEKMIETISPDIICINQTKIDFEAYQKLKKPLFEGYYEYWNFCKISSGYSGVLTLSKFKPISVIEDFPDDQKNSLEGRLLTLEFEDFYILNVYKPNAGKQLERLDYLINDYDVKFLNFAQQLQEKKPIIITGDMNVAHTELDLTNPKANKNKNGFTDIQRQAITKMLDIGLVDSYRQKNPLKQEYTYYSYRYQGRARNVGWRIDYVLSDKRLNLVSATIHQDILGSDHCPTTVQFKLKSK